MPRSEAYNVDCLDYMRTLPAKSFDLAIVDPPYWSPEEQTGRVRTAGNVQATLDLGNKFNRELFDELKRVSKAQIVWGANNYGFPFKGFVVWDKTNIPDKFTLSKCEIASLSDNLGKTAKIFRAPSSYFGLQRIHPTQKPVELYAWLLSTYAPPSGESSTRCSAPSPLGLLPICSATTSSAANSTPTSTRRAAPGSRQSAKASQKPKTEEHNNNYNYLINNPKSREKGAAPCKSARLR
jgi:site-specific DNA-methyltransferase (adenine-specific)